ncbi:hypothetical protein PALB_25950 [Pseudoalteromonas luteoviolacea B = ATCC 29581]|nr:hypothetical protein PALB_25950 [Pseudoalteromonas luteoviolacea B = ATCC 29581]
MGTPLNQLPLMELLNALESQLAHDGLWQNTAIPQHALQSRAPFCCDTMRFEQWLQFVFLKKMRTLLIADVPLPSNFALLPMLEMTFKKNEFPALFDIIEVMDARFNMGY